MAKSANQTQQATSRQAGSRLSVQDVGLTYLARSVMKSYFLEGVASGDAAERALRQALPGQEHPWLLVDATWWIHYLLTLIWQPNKTLEPASAAAALAADGQGRWLDARIVDAPLQPAAQAALTFAWFKRATLAVVLLAVVNCSFFAGSDFQQRAWVADADGCDGVRHAMGKRLAQRGALVGKARGDVVELLGTPILHDEFGDWDLIYDLGPARGFFALGRDFLVIRIGPSGFVTTSRIMSDG